MNRALTADALQASRTPCFVVTCEHGGNEVPRAYESLFRGRARALLSTHRGYDRGALELAQELAQASGARLFASKTTRLLVDLNRSVGHRGLFSQVSGGQSRAVKAEILKRHYFPFRVRAQAFVEHAVSQGLHVIHISSHSFTPVWNGITRNADVGILYDPQRRGERLFCRKFQRNIQDSDAQGRLRVRLNYPYRGNADGFTTHLRRRFGEECYFGIELEINQRHTRPRKHWTMFRRRMVACLVACLQSVQLEEG